LKTIVDMISQTVSLSGFVYAETGGVAASLAYMLSSSSHYGQICCRGDYGCEPVCLFRHNSNTMNDNINSKLQKVFSLQSS